MEFFNAVLKEIYYSLFELIPLLQFKDYVVSQRVTRWKMKTAIGEHIEKINALMNSNSKDGNAINVCHFGNQELESFCYLLSLMQITR